MDEKLLFCISVTAGDSTLYGPEWKEAERGKTLIDLFLQVCGTEILGQQVQVLVSKDRSFLEAAVVQVCSPLALLSEKSQSYIQFILKSDSHTLKHILSGDKSDSINGSKSDFRNSFDSKDRSHTFILKDGPHTYTRRNNILHSGYKLPPFSGTLSETSILPDRWAYQSLSSDNYLSSKPSFENMTVEEICNEIKRIRTTELSKTKLSSWIDQDKKDLKNGTSTDINVQYAKKKWSSEKSPRSCSSTPEPVKTMPKSSTTMQGKSRMMTKLTESARNKLNTNKTKQMMSPAPSQKSNIPPKIKNISDRLSVLAQPRRRYSEPIKTNSMKTIPLPNKSSGSSETIKNKKMVKNVKGNLTMTRGTKVNSTFVKTNTKRKVKTQERTKSAEHSSEYFVEIFTKDQEEKRKHEVEEIKTNMNQSLPDYSTDSLMNQSNDKSSSSEKSSDSNDISSNGFYSEVPSEGVSINSILISLDGDRQQHSISQTIVNGEKSCDSGISVCVAHEQKPASETIPGATVELDVTLDSEETNSDEKIQNFAKVILSNNSNICIENILDDYFSPTSQKSPSRSSLFSPLLEKNNLKHSCSSPVKSPNVSVDRTELDENELKAKTAVESNVNDALTKGADTLVNKSLQAFTDNVSVQQSHSPSEHGKTDRKTDLQTDISVTDESNIRESMECFWSNSRGIKFTSGKSKNEELNRTFVLSDKKDKTDLVDNKSCLNLALSNEPDDVTMSSIMMIKTPEKHRKHWGNNIEGMDHMLMESLQAFCFELRSTTENVAANIRTLYEDWQVRYEGLEASTMNPVKPLVPKTSPRLKGNGGDQQVIATVFRNLRQIEVKLKTIEQAALTMVTAIDGDHATHQQSQQNEEQKKRSLHRAKSFKWTELKTSARNQMRSKPWLRHQQINQTSDVSSDSDA